MADEFSYDGFLSKRSDGDAFAIQLVAELRHRFKVHIALDSDLSKIDDGDHVQAAADGIRQSKFTIIIVGKNRFEPVTDGRPSYQYSEVLTAFEERKKRVNTETPHGIFIVYLVDEPSEETLDEINEELGQIKYGSRTFTNVFDAPLTVDKTSTRWKQAIERTSSAVRNFLDNNAYTTVYEAQGEGQLGQVELLESPVPEDLQGGEFDYLKRNCRNWLKGQIDNIERVEGDTQEDISRRALFDFSPRRSIRLDARVGKEKRPEDKEAAQEQDGQDGNDYSGSARGKPAPVLEWLFDEHAPPILLTGGAGAGKTTTLTTSAALLAAHLGGDLREAATELLDTQLGDLLRAAHLKKRYVPVVIRCAALAKKFGREVDVHKDREEFLRLLCELIDDQSTPSEDDLNNMSDRMHDKPFALFFDALDEVLNTPRAERIVNLIRNIHAKSVADKKTIKIVVSARPSVARYSKLLNLELLPLTMKQINQYFESYAETLEPNPAKATELVDYVREQFTEQERLQDFLSLPFHLNSFCYLARRNRGGAADRRPPNTQAAFYGLIINHLTKGFAPQDPLGDHAMTEGVFRGVLRRLAYDAVGADEKGKLGIDEAIRLCRHTLSTIYGFQSTTEIFTKIEESYAKNFLDHIAQHTELLYRTDRFYAFNRVRFCEYLAGERIDVDALTTTFLIGLRVDKLEDFLPSISFCYALRLQRDVPEYAANVLKGLIDRAYDRLKYDVDEAFKWLNAAMTCFNSGLEADIYSPGQGFDQTGFDLFRDHAVRIIRDSAEPLSPKERSNSIQLLFRLCRRADPAKTVSESRIILERLTKTDTPFVSVKYAARHGDESTVKHVKIERTPVLVCEYEYFLKTQQKLGSAWRDTEYWAHAPLEERHTIDNIDEHDQEGEPPLESWRVQRKNPGNPVCFVTWYEAVAYAQWMSVIARESQRIDQDEFLRLPTADEMRELSISFAGDQKYPWGDNLAEGHESPVNWAGSGIEGVSPPGTFPPFRDIFDFGSNVRCWTIGDADGGPAVWPPPKEVDEWQFAAGGSWADSELGMRAKRPGRRHEPSWRDQRIGIRLVVDRN